MFLRRFFAATAFSLSVVVLTTLAVAGPAQAAPLGFDFEIEFTSGGLSGNKYTGGFVIDDSTFSGTGTETFTSTGSFSGDTLLSFDITVAGFAYTITDDNLFPVYPRVGFTDDVVTYIDYSTGIFSIFYDPVAQVNAVILLPGTASESDFGFGYITSITPNAPAVPLPAGLPLVLTGLAGFAGLRMRKKRNAQV